MQKSSSDEIVSYIKCGNCLDLMNEIPDKSVDMILSDLPFGITANKWDSIIDFDRLWASYNRVIKPDSAIILFAAQPFTTKLINSNMERFKYCWYWIKNQGTNFFHAKRMPIRKVEEICVFNSNRYYPQMLEGCVPTKASKGTSNGKCYYGTNKRDYPGGVTQRFPSNVLMDFKCVDNYHRLHPNEKPVALLEYLIKTYTNIGDIVLDSCMGSGSTCVAAVNTGRRYIGFEMNKDYYDSAEQRIKEVEVEQRE